MYQRHYGIKSALPGPARPRLRLRLSIPSTCASLPDGDVVPSSTAQIPAAAICRTAHKQRVGARITQPSVPQTTESQQPYTCTARGEASGCVPMLRDTVPTLARFAPLRRPAEGSGVLAPALAATPK
jgi:hypothetical protein